MYRLGITKSSIKMVHTSKETDMIYTSYFAKYRGGNGVSIARRQPSKDGAPCYPELARLQPPKSLLWDYKTGRITENEFKSMYRNLVLRGLNPHAWAKRLQGKVLLCWEKPGDFCHRHIVADWLRKAGYEVKEWDKSDGV